MTEYILWASHPAQHFITLFHSVLIINSSKVSFYFPLMVDEIETNMMSSGYYMSFRLKREHILSFMKCTHSTIKK